MIIGNNFDFCINILFIKDLSMHFSLAFHFFYMNHFDYTTNKEEENVYTNANVCHICAKGFDEHKNRKV